jgi:hypothetical protein
MISEQRFTDRVIAEYGDVINLREHPEVIIDIIRKYHGLLDVPDGGLPPGGVGPPTSIQSDDPTNAELMRKLLEIHRTVTKMRQEMKSD